MKTKLQDIYKKFYKTIEEIIKHDNEFNKFKEYYKINKGFWEREYLSYSDYDTQHFIDNACYTRGLPPELSHRIMHDFALFVLLCKMDDYINNDAWLWKPKKWWFYFWKYYEVILKDEDKIKNDSKS